MVGRVPNIYQGVGENQTCTFRIAFDLLILNVPMQFQKFSLKL